MKVSEIVVGGLYHYRRGPSYRGGCVRILEAGVPRTIGENGHERTGPRDGVRVNLVSSLWEIDDGEIVPSSKIVGPWPTEEPSE